MRRCWDTIVSGEDYFPICVYVLCVYTDGVPGEETCHLFPLCWEQWGDRQREGGGRKREIKSVCVCVCVTPLFKSVTVINWYSFSFLYQFSDHKHMFWYFEKHSIFDLWQNEGFGTWDGCHRLNLLLWRTHFLFCNRTEHAFCIYLIHMRVYQQIYWSWDPTAVVLVVEKKKRFPCVLSHKKKRPSDISSCCRNIRFCHSESVSRSNGTTSKSLRDCCVGCDIKNESRATFTWPEKYIHHILIKNKKERELGIMNWDVGGEQTRSEAVTMILHGASSFCQNHQIFSLFLFLLIWRTHILYLLECGGLTRSNFTAVGPNHLRTCGCRTPN